MAVTPPPKGEIKHLARLWRFLAPYKGRVGIAFIALVTAKCFGISMNRAGS